MAASIIVLVGGALLVVAVAVVLAVVLAGGSGDSGIQPSSLTEGNVHITVVHEDGGTIEGAAVHLGTSRGATQENGKWIGQLPAGTASLVVTASTGVNDPSSYQPHLQQLTVPASASASSPLELTVVLAGWSSLTPWSTLFDALATLDAGPATADITYSFIPAGVVVSNNPPGSTVTILDHVDGSLSTADFKAQITMAFGDWKALLESVFSVANGYAHQLTVDFRETVETSSPPLFGPYTDRADGTGDFRIGMWHLDGTAQVLAYAYGPNNAPNNAAGDILFNASVDWRVDADVSDGGDGNGGFSVRYVAAHEIGHSLGFGHHARPGSLMAPTAGRSLQLSGKFPSGLSASTYDRTAAMGIYAGSGATRTI